MFLIERVKAILLRPKQTWPVIAAEPADTASIYSRYVAILAAIPAVAGFLGLSLIGVGAFGVSYRLPIGTGLTRMVVGYVLSLLLVYVMALIVNALAPTFAGAKNMTSALKLVAYASTAGFVGGIFSLLPALSVLGLLAGLYSIYLIYSGIAVMMRCPADKAGAYTAVVVVCAIVAAVVIGALTALVAPISGMGMNGMGGLGSAGGGAGNLTIKAPDGSNVTINSSGMADMAKRMEEAGKRMEAAQNSGDGAAAGKAMSEMMGTLAGGSGASGSAAPIAPADLRALLPEAIGDLKRTSIEAQGGAAMGIGGSTAKANYGAGEQQVELSITDAGGLAGIAAMATWANVTLDKETDGAVEKVYKDGTRTVREDYQKDGSRGELTVILGNGVIVAAEGTRVDVAGLKKTLATIDLGKLEAMKQKAKP